MESLAPCRSSIDSKLLRRSISVSITYRSICMLLFSLSFSANSTRLCLKSHSHVVLHIEHILRMWIWMCVRVYMYLHLSIMRLLESAFLAFLPYYENMTLISYHSAIYLDSAVLLLTSSSAAAWVVLAGSGCCCACMGGAVPLAAVLAAPCDGTTCLPYLSCCSTFCDCSSGLRR